MNATPEAEQWVWLARIRRAQGRKGEVIADILTDFPERFAERKRLWLLRDADATSGAGAARQVELAAHWLHKGGVVLHFAGVDSISAAEELAGLIVAIPRHERAALAEDEIYIGDLIGCEAGGCVGLGAGAGGRDRRCGPRSRTGAAAGGARGPRRGPGTVCKKLPETLESGGKAGRDGAAFGAYGS